MTVVAAEQTKQRGIRTNGAIVYVFLDGDGVTLDCNVVPVDAQDLLQGHRFYVGGLSLPSHFGGIL